MFAPRMRSRLLRIDDMVVSHEMTLWVARAEIDDEDRNSRRRLVGDRTEACVDEENYDTFSEQ